MSSKTQSCSPDLVLPPWALDAPPEGAPPKPVYGPGASEHDVAPAATPVQTLIPAKYRKLSAAELDERIATAKASLAERLVILGHHYQRDEIIKFADFTGDSFKLSQLAAGRGEADYIVFCGVHFMAESADILSGDHQTVILPNMAAGCSMADMANIDDVTTAWEELHRVLGPASEDRKPLLPITYMNSAASLKAFCGREGGSVCTSSNATAIVQWALDQADRVLFFPDEHLGRNTAYALGFSPDQVAVWNPRQPMGGLAAEQIERAKLIVWKGWCSVHTRFTVDQIREARAEDPDVNIIVHPECTAEVVNEADEVGSTEKICKVVRAAPAGTKWAIGTEINLVRRLADEMPDKEIWCLDPIVCPCSTMYRIHPAYLCWVLESLVEGNVVNQLKVDETTATWAKVALDRMLEIGR